MRLLALCCLLLTGCYDQIAVSANAGMTCYYDDIVIWSGQVALDGVGLQGFEDRLSGEWTFYLTPEDRTQKARTRCDLKVPKAE